MNFLTTKNIISLIGAIGISTIIGTMISFVQTNKKNHLDVVTSERSEWRKRLKEIITNLNSEDTRSKAINELRSQINPYGRNMAIKNTKPYFMKDGHIWDMSELGEKVDHKKLAFFVELLLKYDWERSKREVQIKPFQFIQASISFILVVLQVYLIYKNDVKLDNLGAIIHVFISSMVVLILLLQNMATRAAYLNLSKNENRQIWIFLLFYALPYGCIMYNTVKSFNLGDAVLIIAVLGLVAYEFFYIFRLYDYEDKYVKEIERHLSTKSRKYQEGIKLENQIQAKENKLYRYEYDNSTINTLKSKLKKIKKQLTKKKRPQNYCCHPILFFKYRRNRKRIIREVKKWKRRR